ncbi:MAG TPA: DUF6788 family protein [Candidatus Saccharimonadales bacterium]|nr:DUF6788 family protein [Candidatus Saccharimonadales bacterium]
MGLHLPSQPGLPELEEQRTRLYADLSQVGDFRPGSLAAVRRRCGRPNCGCSDPAHSRHGPEYNLTRTVAGKTVGAHFKPGPQLEKVRREVANYKHFRGLVEEIVEVSEQICETRPVAALAADQPPAKAERKKRALCGAPTRLLPLPGVRPWALPPGTVSGRRLAQPGVAAVARGGNREPFAPGSRELARLDLTPHSRLERSYEADGGRGSDCPRAGRPPQWPPIRRFP